MLHIIILLLLLLLLLFDLESLIFNMFDHFSLARSLTLGFFPSSHDVTWCFSLSHFVVLFNQYDMLVILLKDLFC